MSRDDDHIMICGNDDILLYVMIDYEHSYDHFNFSINVIVSRDDGKLTMIL